MSNAVVSEQTLANPPRCTCPKCSELRSLAVALRPKKTLKRGDDTHESWGWTVVHWDERDPESPHWRVMITCHHCGHDSFVPKTSIRQSSWNGYCSDCVERFGIPGKRRTLTGIHINPFGAEIDYNAPHSYNRAWVKCPNFSTCGGREEKRVDKSNQDKQPFYCNRCLSEQRKRPWRDKLGLRKSGRPPARSDNENFIAAVDEIIRDWHRNRPGARLSSPELAEKLQSRHIYMPDDTLRKKIKRLLRRIFRGGDLSANRILSRDKIVLSRLGT
jgi:hypothetical protein